MRITVFVAALLLFAFSSSCTKSANEPALLSFEATGQLLGSDKALCPCCGGWIITIDDDDGVYRIESLPEDSEIELSEEEISVRFNWSVDRECGFITYINIEEIELN